MENTIRAVIAFVILGILIYVGIQILPIYMDHWDLEDEIEEKVLYAFTTGGGGSKVEKRLTEEIANSLTQIGAVYKEKDIHVSRKKGTKQLTVEVWYERSHNLPILENPKQFYIHVQSAAIKTL